MTTRARALTHVMEPVLPGCYAVATIGGGPLGRAIHAVRLPDGPARQPRSAGLPERGWKRWPIAQATGECATVDVPAGPFGVYALAADPDGPADAVWIANRPRLDWCWPQAAVAGEPLRIVGRGLADISRYRQRDPLRPVSYGGLLRGATALLTRRVGEARFTRIAVDRSSAYEAHARWPAGLPEGEYELFAHSGRGGVHGWSDPLRIRATRADRWPRRVFRVRPEAAGGNVDDAIATALDALRRNGGGVLAFGPGTFGITRPIVLPARCVLRGEGADRTCISGPAHGGPSAPWVLITGDGDFAVEDVRLFTVYAPLVIVAPTFLPGSFREAYDAPFGWSQTRARNVTVRRCRIEQAPNAHLPRRVDADPEWRKWLKDWTATSDGQGYNGFVAIRLRGDGALIEDNEIWGGGSAVILTGCSYVRAARNTLKAGCSGHGMYIMGHLSWPADWATNPDAKPLPVIGNYSHRVLVEENRFEAYSERARDLCYFNYGAEFGFVTRNTYGPMQINNDCEGLAFHLWPAKWRRPRVTALSPTRYRITDPEGEVRREELVGSVLSIIDGPGIGQVRTVVARAGDEVEIDQPFRYAPGPDSTVAFSAPPPFRGMTLVDNAIVHTGANILLWGDSHDVVVDGNVSRDNGHITVWCVRSFEDQKVWGGAAFTQIIHNRSEDAWLSPPEARQAANYFGGCISNPACRNPKVPLEPGYDYLGLIIRDNACRNHSGIVYRTRYALSDRSIWKLHDAGVVIERNFSSDARFGVAVEADAPACLRANRTRRVRHPVVRFPPIAADGSSW